MEEKLELRMYGLVPYQLSGIQSGIQFGHAKDQYSKDHNTELYNDWLYNYQTYIILDGGTTNTNPTRPGTLNQYAQQIAEMNIPISCFYEPDLGDQLLGIAFIVDERVFDHKKHPDYDDWYLLNVSYDEAYSKGYDSFGIGETLLEFAKSDKDSYEKWVNTLGGYRNLKLREFLYTNGRHNFKLAN